MRCSPVIAVLVITGACFDPAISDDAVVLCADDDACSGGQRCDLQTHVCTGPGDDVRGPSITASFSPAVAASGIVTLDLAGDEPLSASPAPILVFASTDPAFTLADGAGTRTLSLAIDAAGLDEGFYALTSVIVADTKGNVATSNVDATLKIDRTPPLVDRVVVVGGIAGVLADRDGADDVVVTFDVSEPVDASLADVRIGTLTLACVDADNRLALACTGSVPAGGGGTQNGRNALSIVVEDAAGNEGTVQATVDVDLDGPHVVPGSVELRLEDDGATFVTVGEELELRFLSDEPLAAPPEVTLSGGEGTTFTVDAASTGNLWVLRTRIEVVAAGAPELRQVEVRLVDVFGHERALEVPLPAPHLGGLRVVAFPESPCIVPPREDGSTCTDFDGDGHFGVSPGCTPSLRDCDDRDPSVHPFASEIAGDGVGNDCDGEDEPLDGLFVDAANGDDAAAGTRTAPLRSLNEAIARDERRPIILAADQRFATTAEITVPLYGGRDPRTWERIVGATSEVSNGLSPCLNLARVRTGVVEAVAFREGFEAFESVVLRDVESSCFTFLHRRALVIGGNLELFTLEGGGSASGTRVIGERSLVDLSSVEAVGVDLVFHRVRVLDGITVSAGSELTVTNSIIRTDGDHFFECNSCARVGVFHSNLLGGQATSGFSVLAACGSSVTPATCTSTAISIVGNIVRLPGRPDAGGEKKLITLSEPVSLRVVGNLIDQPAACSPIDGVCNRLLEITNLRGLEPPLILADAAGFSTLNACAWPGCDDAGLNQSGDVNLLANDVDVDESSGVSAARGVVLDPTVYNVPTFIAGDAEGTCRGAPPWNAGAREL